MPVGPERFGEAWAWELIRKQLRCFFCWPSKAWLCEPRRYFLSQGFRVVAVEANRRAIEAGRAQGRCGNSRTCQFLTRRWP